MTKRKSKNKVEKRSSRGLVVHRLENVSKVVFRKHYNLITALVGSSPGVYALYDGSELYYVGRSTELRKRVRHHLRDRHLASWTHFSLYLVRKASHISEIESLLVRIANPKGNRTIPRGKASSTMLKKLRSMVREKQKEDFEEMFGVREARAKRGTRRVSSRRKGLKGLVQKRTRLYRTYKGREYRATLSPTGIIRVGNMSFTTPTAAAAKIVRRRTVNGWNFWYIRDSSGDWVKLCDYKG